MVSTLPCRCTICGYPSSSAVCDGPQCQMMADFNAEFEREKAEREREQAERRPRPIDRIRKLLVMASDPRANEYEATIARSKRYEMLALGIARAQVDISDVLDVLPEQLFDRARPQ
jgi:hypothetical protein